MIERRSGIERRTDGHGRARVSEVEQALETIRFLRPEILKFVQDYGAASAGYFDRVIDAWYRGSLSERVAFVRSCASDKAMTRAWRIVHAAGALAAPLVPYAVRRYYGQRVPRGRG
jgi:hypothetical protein